MTYINLVNSRTPVRGVASMEVYSPNALEPEVSRYKPVGST